MGVMGSSFDREATMRNRNRINLRGIGVAVLIVALVLTGCTGKPTFTKSDSAKRPASVGQASDQAPETQPPEASADKAAEASASDVLSMGELRSMGWQVPTAKELRGTTWTAWNERENGLPTVSVLKLYGGEGAEYGDYDGEASLFWQYDGEEEPQEHYEGWWRLEELDGQTCLRLDLLCNAGALFQGDANPQRISELFPLLWDTQRENLALGKGVQNGTLLPFHSEQMEFACLMKSIE